MRLRRVLLAATALVSLAAAADNDPEIVRKAQQALTAQGYDPGPIDGQWRGQTEQALKQAQQDREFEPSGALDQRTLAALGVPDADNPFMRDSSASTGTTRQAPPASASPAPSPAAPSSR
jgi:hypothetical protein